MGLNNVLLWLASSDPHWRTYLVHHHSTLWFNNTWIFGFRYFRLFTVLLAIESIFVVINNQQNVIESNEINGFKVQASQALGVSSNNNTTTINNNSNNSHFLLSIQLCFHSEDYDDVLHILNKIFNSRKYLLLLLLDKPSVDFFCRSVEDREALCTTVWVDQSPIWMELSVDRTEVHFVSLQMTHWSVEIC